MNELLTPLVLLAVLVIAAVSGPYLIRAAAPLLMRAPRAAVALLGGSLMLWLAAFAALSLMLAWLITGPPMLPAPLDDVCARCLAAASPFAGAATVDTPVPVLLLLLIPALASAAMLILGLLRALHLARRTRTFAAAVAAGATRAVVAGHDVLLTRDEQPLAFSLPRRRGGIVISQGLLSELESSELAAVLEHERAHVRQRHHLIIDALDAVAWPLRRLPLAGAVLDAVPHYLEIAADNAARHSTGTPALAGALLKLGAPRPAAGVLASSSSGARVLHAAGPNRIRQMVAPSAVRSAILPAGVFGTMLVAFAAVVAAVHGPYLYVLLTGCQLPA